MKKDEDLLNEIVDYFYEKDVEGFKRSFETRKNAKECFKYTLKNYRMLSFAMYQIDEEMKSYEDRLSDEELENCEIYQKAGNLFFKLDKLRKELEKKNKKDVER